MRKKKRGITGGAQRRVLDLLRKAKRGEVSFRMPDGSRLEPGWVPIYQIIHPNVGGAAGTMRLRELRNCFGVQYNWKYWVNSKGETTNTTVYCLTDHQPETLEAAI